jgi:hypothetical protein
VRRILLAFTIFAICSLRSAIAAPMPLIEFSYETTNFQGGLLPSAAPFSFLVEDERTPQPALKYVDWAGDYRPADVGVSFFAPAGIVAGANLGLASATALYSMKIGSTNFSSSAILNALPTGTNQLACQGFPCKNPLVPNLREFTVTAVERIINELQLSNIQPNQSYLLEGKQTIRFWGVRVPEPPTCAFIVFWLWWYTSRTCAVGINNRNNIGCHQL